jgi:non-ribosomal peptide synthetase component E (peptide arylation enzyme)
MIESFGETVFRFSNNIQRRVGDPIRELDYDAIELQRPELGLSDGQIARKIGLTEAQVVYIRNVMEWRHFERSNYHRLNELGGGRRYRPEREVSANDLRSQHQRAQALREAIAYPGDLVAQYIAKGYWQGDTIRGWIDKWAVETTDAPVILHADQSFGYGEYAKQVRHLADAFYDLGLRKGDVVAIQLPNIPEYLIGYAALAYMGAVMTTLYMPHRRQEMQTLMAHSGARAIICLTDAGGFDAAATAVDLQSDLADLEHVIALGAAVPGALSFADLMAGPANGGEGEIPVAGDPLMLLYTSGTTSSPKGVPHSSHTLLSNAKVGLAEHKIGPDDVLMSAAPFGHLFALYSFHLALAAGAANLLLPIFTPPDMVKVAAAGKATVLFTAPAHIAACLGMGLFDAADLGAMKMSIMSGAAVPPDLARRFSEKLPTSKIAQLWGMTETQAGLYTRPDDAIEVSANSAGRISPGTELRIMNDDGNECTVGDVGELWLRGPLMFPGYFDNPVANEKAFSEDGYFLSGDLATIDPDGNVAIVGRTKDVINRGGVKYNPRDVEDLLDGHPKIMQSAIVPMTDPVLGEKACCFVTLSGDESVSLEELCDYLAGHAIAKTKLPERLEIVSEMPLTPTRKIIKAKLVSQL